MKAKLYIGSELEIFAHAQNWKRYWISRLGPYLTGDVLEVGAGMGANTLLLRSLCAGRWLCLEPDAGLMRKCVLSAERLGLSVEAVCGTLEDVPPAQRFDTALYIDVLEHIDDDAGELQRLTQRMRPGGCVIVLAPAHQKLFSPFDQAIGHFRRYDVASLGRIAPAGWTSCRREYLDSFGFFLSLANRRMLRQSEPTLRQVLLWDRALVPLSRYLDPLTGFRFGRSVLSVWRVP